MAKHIVVFEGKSSHLRYDSRVRKYKLTAEVEKITRGWDHSSSTYWVTVKKDSKMLFTCRLEEWAAVMELFDKAVITVTGKSLEKMFGQDK